MASELNMYESQVSEYKYEIERLARELQDVKKKILHAEEKRPAVKVSTLHMYPFHIKTLRIPC